jgi:hypothetical protein
MITAHASIFAGKPKGAALTVDDHTGMDLFACNVLTRPKREGRLGVPAVFLAPNRFPGLFPDPLAAREALCVAKRTVDGSFPNLTFFGTCCTVNGNAPEAILKLIAIRGRSITAVAGLIDGLKCAIVIVVGNSTVGRVTGRYLQRVLSAHHDNALVIMGSLYLFFLSFIVFFFLLFVGASPCLIVAIY